MEEHGSVLPDIGSILRWYNRRAERSHMEIDTGDGCLMDKPLVRYELKTIPRDTTREEWKAISTWLRQRGQHVSGLLRDDLEETLHDLLAFGVYPKGVRSELGLLRRGTEHEKAMDPVYRRFCEIRDDIVDYFRPTG